MITLKINPKKWYAVYFDPDYCGVEAYIYQGNQLMDAIEDYMNEHNGIYVAELGNVFEAVKNEIQFKLYK